MPKKGQTERQQECGLSRKAEILSYRVHGKGHARETLSEERAYGKGNLLYDSGISISYKIHIALKRTTTAKAAVKL